MKSDAAVSTPAPRSGTATLTGQIAGGELAPGDVLGGRFRIESLLGVGGMGVVYKARDLSLDIDVALKLLRPELARKPGAFERFRNELLLARQVSSPHVVRIHDIAEHDGRWYISMDFIDGESLESYRDRVGKIPLEGALAITRGLLEGLAAAHQRGVVHRDLKPANVLLDGNGHPYITDFGVARSLGATGMTQSGIIVGTPEYLSPEQARGDPADARSDLYTAGLILYEMLSGALPFAGGTPAETVIQRIVRPPPSLASVRPDLPRWLHAFCERLMKIRPAHRFANARDALRALDTKRVPRPPVNRRVVFAVVAVGVAIALGATYVWRHPIPIRSIVAPSAPVVPRIAILPFHVETGDADLAAAARGIEAHAREWLRGDAAVAVASRSRVAHALARSAPDLEGSALMRQLPEIARAANANRILRGGLTRSPKGIALELSWLAPGAAGEATHVTIEGRDAASLFAAYESAFAAFARSAGLKVGPPPNLVAAALPAFGRGLVALDAGRSEAAASDLDAAAKAAPDSALVRRELLDAEEAAGQDLPAQKTREAAIRRFANDPTPSARTLVARALADEGKDAESDRTLAAAAAALPHDPVLTLQRADALERNGRGEDAIKVLKSLVASDDQDARAWFLLGRISIQQAEASVAVEDYLLRALVLNVRSGDAAAEAETRNALGVGYEHLGQLDAAVEQYRTAAAMREKLGDQPGLAKTLRNLAIVEAVMGRREEAEKTLDRVKSILEAIGDQASLADLYNDRGVVAEERGDYASAIASYREALAIRRRLDDPSLIAESLNNIGYSSYQLGRFDDALVYWEQARDAYRKIDDQRGLLHVEQSIALLDTARGHLDDAEKKLTESLKKAEDSQLPEEVAAAQISLADLYLLEGRFADAKNAAGRAEQFFARRSDERGEVEAHLSEARIALAIGDAKEIDAALAAIPREKTNREQRAELDLAAARRAFEAGDATAAGAHLDDAAKSAAEAHAGVLDFRIRLERAREALVAGDIAQARELVKGLRAETTLLGQVPLHLHLVEIEMAVALRTGARDEAVQRYREALSILKDAGRVADAAILHELGARAFPAGSADANAAAAAAKAARSALIDAAPESGRAALEASLAKRLREEVGDGS